MHGARGLGSRVNSQRIRRFFASGGSKERKNPGAAGAGRRPGRNGEGVRRIWRISRTFDHLRRRAWGRKYKLIDESKPRRTRTWEAEKSSKKAVTRAYACTDDCTSVVGRRHRGGAAAGGATHVPRHSLVTLFETTHEARSTLLLERRGYAWAFW